jgi:hypothetical protein
VVWSALGAWLRVEPLEWARLMAWLLGVGMIGALAGGWVAPRGGGAAAIVLAGCVPLAVWTMGGLETTMVAALVMGLCVASARLETAAGRWAAGALLVALVMARPEGPMYAVIPAAGAIGLRDRRRLLPVAGAVAGAVLLYTLWRGWYFGTVVPNTVSAKVGGGAGATLLAGIRYLFDGGVAMLGLLALALEGCRAVRWSPLARAAAAAVGVQLLFALGTGGDWMPAARFLVPATGAAAILAALAMGNWSWTLRWAMVALACLASLFVADRDPYLRWCRWAAREGNGLLVEPLRTVGLHLRTVAQPSDLLAATEAGVLPYTARLPFIDMLGLVDRHIASLPGGLHQKWDADYVLGRAPRWIVLGVVETSTGDAGAWAPDQALLAHPDFLRLYRPVGRWPRLMPPPDFNGLLPGAMILYERIAP